MAGFWVALGLFVSIYSYRLGLGDVANPGPGLFPFCLGVILFIIAAIVFTQIIIKTTVRKTEKEKPGNLPKVIGALAVLFTSALLVEVLGYLLITFAAMAVLFRIGGYHRIIQILGYSAVAVIITYLLFTYLGVHFPPGIVRFLGLY